MSRFGRGYRPDPAGHRANGFHLLAAAAVVSTPQEADIERHCPPVLDQNECGSCTGHGTATGIFAACSAAGRPLPFVPSPRAIYLNARAVDRTSPSEPLSDEGAMPNQVMRSITEWGVRPIKAPTSKGYFSDCEPANVNVEPTLSELEQEAHDALVGWYRISSTGAKRIADLRAALAAGYPVGIGTFVATSFEDWQAGDPPIGHQDESDPNGGGHWICILGYRTNAAGSTEFKIRNSWGESWGDRGNIWAAESFVQQATDLYAFAVTAKELV